MAAKKKKDAIQKVIIVGSILIVLQIIYIFVFNSDNPKSVREVINQQVGKLGGSSREKERKRILAAVFDYRSKNSGRLPKDLSDLVPVYFDVIPVDSDTGKPFGYWIEGGVFYVGDRGKDGSKKEEGSTISQSEQDALIASLTDDESKTAFTYDPTGKRDPFRPFNFAPKPSEGTGVTPLERYSIGQLKLTAVLGHGDGASAMVENSAGRGFPVTKGTKIGTNGGEVVEILPDRVLILETVIDFTGQAKTKTVEMRLRTKDQEQHNR